MESDRAKAQAALAKLMAKREEQEKRLMQTNIKSGVNCDESRKDVETAPDRGQTFSMAALSLALPAVQPAQEDTSLLDRIHESLTSSRKPEPQVKLTAGFVPGSQGDTLHLEQSLASKLYPHQKTGVEWLFSLYQQKKGGILGDDMGLGKTMQVSAFLSSMMKGQRGTNRRALIVAPKTLLAHWQKELEVCGLGRSTYSFFEGGRADALRSVKDKGGVLLTTYGMVLFNHSLLNLISDQAWDCIVLDEGHRIKNPKTKLSLALHEIQASTKVIVSGTPIQNNLLEMHALFDWCCEGLLGDRKQFQRTFEKVITSGQDRSASERDRVKGAAVAEELRRIISPFFLRREKKEVLKPQDGEGGSSSSSSGGQGISLKNDLVIWLSLTPLQQSIYKSFLKSPAVSAALNNTGSVLASLSVLKKVCDHPGLLSTGAASSVIKGSHKWVNDERSKREDLIVIDSEEEDSIHSSSDEDDDGEGEVEGEDQRGSSSDRLKGTADEEDDGWMSLAKESIEERLLKEIETKGSEASCKSSFVLNLLPELSSKGHRTLIFSQSRVMLDILEVGVKTLGLSLCRIDGTMDVKERQDQVKRFQREGSDVAVFLLTSQVGGLGLTLTAADRVIICDPAWNPSVDSQAVDRAYRIGQKRNVIVYRLMSCGTVEEKIYRKQISKLSLAKAGTEEGIQWRYFSHSDLKDLFSVSSEGLVTSKTQVQLSKLHSSQRQLPPGLKEHIEWIERFSAGVSDHDLLFSVMEEGGEAPRPGEGRKILDSMRVEGDAFDVSRPGSKLKGATLVEGEKEDERVKVEREGRKRIEGLHQAIKRQHELLRTMGHSMADGGLRIKSKISELEKELAVEQARIKSLEDSALSPQTDHSQAPEDSASFVTATSGDADEVVLVGETPMSRRRTYIDLTQD